MSRRTWKLSVSGIGVSAASICFRSFSSWFIQDPSSAYCKKKNKQNPPTKCLHLINLYVDIGTYNITSICIVLGAIIWIPFGFCRSHKYVGGDDSNSTTNDNHRSRIISTGGPVTYRPNNEESNIDGDELPSYYEMISPPPYKSKRSTPSHRDSALLAENETSPSTRSDIVHNDTLSRSNGGLVYNDPPLSFTPNPTITIVPAYTATARDPIP